MQVQTQWNWLILKIIAIVNIWILWIFQFLSLIKTFQDCNGDALVTCEDYTMIHKVRSSGQVLYFQVYSYPPHTPQS